jgi:putative PIN family toxin of toxin-antitoxin system
VRVCLDTNVWVSGIVFRGAPARVVQFALERKFVVVTSRVILDEVERILESKFEVPRKDVVRLTRRITEIADVYEPRGELRLI